jgi:hypothetical protein
VWLRTTDGELVDEFIGIVRGRGANSSRGTPTPATETTSEPKRTEPKRGEPKRPSAPKRAAQPAQKHKQQQRQAPKPRPKPGKRHR